MNLHQMLQSRAAEGRPVRAGLIGSGKFGSMFLAQVPTTPGLTVTAIADLDPNRPGEQLRATGWSEADAADVHVTDDGAALAARDDVDVVIEATGSPAAGIAHARAAFANGKHVVMTNVEADALTGPLLAAEAAEAGVVHAMAYGDQPALVAELVDWARTCGFSVVAAGKGTRYQPAYHALTPETVWDHYGLTADEAADAGMNPKMFTSFMDGTKSAIEMAAIANACGLGAPTDGLKFPACGVDDLPQVMRPADEGGILDAKGMVEVVASEERDGRPVFRDLRWGVYVVVEAPNAYTADCFRQYGVKTDATGRYAALYRPCHLIGLELGLSVANAALRREPTGETRSFNADVAAVAKRDLAPGEILDGEGGTCVWGRLMPAPASLELRALPIGLAHGIAVTRAVKAGRIVTRDDVEAGNGIAWEARAEMERRFG